MTPFALGVLGAESLARRRDSSASQSPAESSPAHSETRTSRTTRRTTSYHAAFQPTCSVATDDPPSYPSAIRHPPPPPRSIGGEPLPKYSCTVSAEAKVLLHVESRNPLQMVSDSEWKEVVVVVRGTLLALHRPKDAGPGRLLRTYTLQHAELGLATDTEHVVLRPQTRLAHLIPSAARQRAWQRDPDLFQPVRQHVLRVRAETDQLLLASSSEAQIHSLVQAMSAAIDIALPIDERSIPKQCTVPRRRRRQPAAPISDLNDPQLLAQQERILRDMYPAFAEQSRGDGQPDTPITPENAPSEAAPPTPAREEDDLDLAAIREEAPTPSPSPLPQADGEPRPSMSRQVTPSSPISAYSNDMMYATSPDNFDDTGKWVPPHTRTPLQIQRYIRRCMPVLLADSPRASDILMYHGRRVKINWRMELLETWELRPPSYKSHGFTPEPDSERDSSILDMSPSPMPMQDSGPASPSVHGSESEDPITPAEVQSATYSLAKAKSAEQGFPFDRPVVKAPSPTHGTHMDYHGVVFCF